MNRKFLVCVAMLLTAGALFAGGKKESKGAEGADISYAMGVVFGSQLEQILAQYTGVGITVDYDVFFQAMRLMMDGKEPLISLGDAEARIEEAISAERARQAQDNLAKSALFFEENGKRPGVATTDSGLQYEVLVEGSGRQPEQGGSVSVIYEARLESGEVFDSSSGDEVDFVLDGVIPGFQEGVLLMKEGGKSVLYVPPELGYGPDGAGSIIPPNAVLIFEVELVKVL